MFCIQRYQLRKPVLFIGFMASGKTTTAKNLSKITGSKCLDIDKEIVFFKKRTISEIFNNEGVDKFRSYENDAMKKNCDKTSFISTGGGCVDNPQNHPILDSHFCVYLQADFDVLKNRISNSMAYPMYKSDNNAKALLKKRSPLYEKFANVIIDVNNKDVSEVCEEIRKILLDKKILIY